MNQTNRHLSNEGRVTESRYSKRSLISSLPLTRGVAPPTPLADVHPTLPMEGAAPLSASDDTAAARDAGSKTCPNTSHGDKRTSTYPTDDTSLAPSRPHFNPASTGSLRARKIFGLLLCLLPLLSACSKSVEDQQMDMVLSIMTDGRWLVQNFAEQNTDLSSEFSGYEFQFLANGTVQGIKGTSVTDGTWSASAASYSITSQFPTVDAPLKRLNDSWKITNSTLRTVEARPMDNLRNAYLKLVKK